MIKFTAEYKDKTYTFDFGYEAYIFHIALCNEFAYKFNEAELGQRYRRHCFAIGMRSHHGQFVSERQRVLVREIAKQLSIL